MAWRADATAHALLTRGTHALLTLWHRVETYRDVTSVPTFFVRMLRKLLDACI